MQLEKTTKFQLKIEGDVSLNKSGLLPTICCDIGRTENCCVYWGQSCPILLHSLFFKIFIPCSAFVFKLVSVRSKVWNLF